MRLYTLKCGEAKLLGTEVEGGYIDLRRAYRERLLAIGACATEKAAVKLSEALIPTDLVQLIEMGEEGAKACDEALKFSKGEVHGPSGAGGQGGADGQGEDDGGIDAPWFLPNERVTVEAPIQTPGKFLCIGVNYRKHILESGAELPKAPVFFNKFATSITGPYDPVMHQGSDVTSELDYEVELGVVIGKRGKYIPADEALDYVYGYTVINDISARDLQHSDGQWVKGKALDTYAPLGPCVVTADEVEDPGNLQLGLTVNGETRQSSSTSELVFSVAELIAYLSRLMTLEPGDIISTGTPSGVGGAMEPPKFLTPGDVMEAHVEGLGVLRNEIKSGA